MSTQDRFYVLKLEEYFAFKNTCLLKRISIKRTRGIKHIQLNINGLFFDPTKTSIDSIEFDMEEIRKRCNEVLGLTQEENDLLRLDEYFRYNQLRAIQYYSTCTKEQLNTSIFTSELTLFFKVNASEQIKRLEVTETSYKSDVQLEKETKK